MRALCAALDEGPIFPRLRTPSFEHVRVGFLGRVGAGSIRSEGVGQGRAFEGMEICF